MEIRDLTPFTLVGESFSAAQGVLFCITRSCCYALPSVTIILGSVQLFAWAKSVQVASQLANECHVISTEPLVIAALILCSRVPGS